MKINVHHKQLESQLSCNISHLILFALWLCVPSTENCSVTVPLQLHATTKFIAVLESCFALMYWLLQKKKKKGGGVGKGFREVREAQQLSQERQN